MNCFTPAKALAAIIAGAMICAIGGLLSSNLPLILKKFIYEKLTPSPDAPPMEAPPIPMYSKFYIFNYTNHLQFMAGCFNGTKPKVTELGPYVYRMYSKQLNRTFYDNDTTTISLSSKYYMFEPSLSKGSESDVIVIPNIPLRAFAQAVPEDSADMVASFMDGESFKLDAFVVCTVGQLLFEGYDSDVLETVESLGMPLPTGTRFGLQTSANNSVSVSPLTATGKGNYLDVGKVIAYGPDHDITSIPQWEGTDCEVIDGVAPGPFHPEVTKDEVLKIFMGELCRNVKLRYKGVVLHFGVPLYRFQPDADMFGDANVNPENACYCADEGEWCRPTGVYSLKKCMGAPMAISWPHFLMGEKYLVDSIDGLKPNTDKHLSHMDILPLLGVPLHARIQVQINLEVRRVPWFPTIDNLPNIYLPVMWSSDGAFLDEELTKQITSMVNTVIMASNMAPLGVIILGGLIGSLGILCSVVVNFQIAKKDRRNVVHIKKQAWVSPSY